MSERHFSLGEVAKAFGALQEWTPKLWDDSSSDGEGQTYGGNNQGYYVRIGNLVFITGTLDVAGLGTLTTANAARIGNLPYNANTSYNGGISCIDGSGLNLGGAGVISGRAINNYLLMRQWNAASGPSSLTVAEVTATGEIIFFGFYTTDSPV